jgi:5-methyltetrahydropteroyltriglutamate--homocysteine methyltransferase
LNSTPCSSPSPKEDDLRRAVDRILVSHAGNLPRPDYLDELIRGDRQNSLGAEYTSRLPQAVGEIVKRQIDVGIDIVNDGEYANAGSYGGYMHDRVTGYSRTAFDGTVSPKRSGTGERDRREFPGFYTSGLWYSGSGGRIRPGFAVQDHPQHMTD